MPARGLYFLVLGGRGQHSKVRPLHFHQGLQRRGRRALLKRICSKGKGGEGFQHWTEAFQLLEAAEIVV